MKKDKHLKKKTDEEIRRNITKSPLYVYGFMLIGFCFATMANFLGSLFWFSFAVMYIVFAGLIATDMKIDKLTLELRELNKQK